MFTRSSCSGSNRHAEPQLRYAHASYRRALTLAWKHAAVGSCGLAQDYATEAFHARMEASALAYVLSGALSDHAYLLVPCPRAS